MFKYKSKINMANTKSNSLRVGIPKEIVKILGVSAGDKIQWNVDVNMDNGKVSVIAEKSE